VSGEDTDLLGPLEIVVSPNLHLKKETVSVSETCSLAFFRLLDGGQNPKPINPEKRPLLSKSFPLRMSQEISRGKFEIRLKQAKILL
jgi:hypothetical protein